MAQAIEALVDATEADPSVRVVVLASADPAVFSAGADLKEVAAGRRSSLRTERGGFAGLAYARRAKPWIAAVEGKALAGGFELVLACDFIVASSNASFGLPEVKRSLIAAAGGLHRLRRRVPYALAAEMLLTGDPIDAARAQAAGLLNALVAPGECVGAALALAERTRRQRTARRARQPAHRACRRRPERAGAAPAGYRLPGPPRADRGLPGRPACLHREAGPPLDGPLTVRPPLHRERTWPSIERSPLPRPSPT
jgi:enoyl-CoA hydratase/carnithine racemase